MVTRSCRMTELKAKACLGLAISLICLLVVSIHVQTNKKETFIPLLLKLSNPKDPQHLYTGKNVFDFSGQPRHPKYIFTENQKQLSSNSNVHVNKQVSVVNTTLQKTDSSNTYAIVFDAGSTGSRVHIFHFHVSSGFKLELKKDLFKKTEPGLSSYADDPQKGAESLRPLIIEALAFVPKSKQKSTPVCLKATAGLRLLPGSKSDDILKEVKSLFNEYPFPVGDVSIMDGTDEGIFSWMTLNFLLGHLSGGNKSVAALDLGGGSTQLTFVPKEETTLKSAPEKFLKHVSLFNHDYKLYTHSYLGEGLMAARLNILLGNQTEDTVSSTSVLVSPCLPVGFNGTFSFGTKQYPVSGPSENVTYEDCYKIAKIFVEKNIQKIAELSNTDIYIFSYFFDRAKESGILSSSASGTATIDTYIKSAHLYFQNPKRESPFLGMDLTYISALLKDGYMIKTDKELQVTKTVKGTDISWALGASFRLLSFHSSAR